jgi:hypothetical protein
MKIDKNNRNIKKIDQYIYDYNLTVKYAFEILTLLLDNNEINMKRFQENQKVKIIFLRCLMMRDR